MTRTEKTIAIGATLLSFLGALLGVYVGSRLEQSNWESRFALEQKRTILEKRVALLERTVVLFNKAPIIVGLRASLDAEKQLVRSSSKGRIERVEMMAKEIHNLNSEYASTMTLNSIYFGEATKKAIKALGADPWSVDSRLNQALIDAMGRELNEFPK